jgi:hypothetical protein
MQLDSQPRPKRMKDTSARARRVCVLALVVCTSVLGEERGYTSYDRSSTSAPAFIAAYLTKSKDQKVIVSGKDYIGVGSVSHEGNVCSYPETSLRLEGSVLVPGEDRGIERTIYMMVSKGACPIQDSTKYVATQGVTSDHFSGIVKAWSEFASSEDGILQMEKDLNSSRNTSRATETALAGIRQLISRGRANELRILHISISSSRWIRTYYQLHIDDPDESSTFFGVSISKSLGSDYTVSGISGGIY